MKLYSFFKHFVKYHIVQRCGVARLQSCMALAFWHANSKNVRHAKNGFPIDFAQRKQKQKINCYATEGHE